VNDQAPESQSNFADKFIGFVDVLGFTQLVEKAEAGEGMPLNRLLELLKALGSPADQERFATRGPAICPQSARTRHDIDFRLTQVSDCVIVSTEISPAGAINLVNHCWNAVISLLQHGLMCRGYITRGRIFHTETQVIGTGYQRAYRAEQNVKAFQREADERGTPFVEVDKTVCDYVAACADACVQEMFSRSVQSDGEVVALFPFKRLAHRFVIGDHRTFDSKKDRKANENVRATIQRLMDQLRTFVDSTDQRAMRKLEHYLRCLDVQLAVCNQTEAFLNLYDSKPDVPAES
jgi:hypothetical protein